MCYAQRGAKILHYDDGGEETIKLTPIHLFICVYIYICSIMLSDHLGVVLCNIRVMVRHQKKIAKNFDQETTSSNAKESFPALPETGTSNV